MRMCPDCFHVEGHHPNCPSYEEEEECMSIDYYAEVEEAIWPYRFAINKADPSLPERVEMNAASILRDLEEDPFNCKDYKSVGIAINQAKESYYE